MLRALLTISGLALICASAFLVAIPLGLLVSGCALLVIESLLGG